MHIASLSQRHPDMPLARVQRAAAPAPTPPMTASSAAAGGCCDSPRRSPLYQSLLGALSGIADATAAPASDGTAEPAPDLDDAVMDFAHALMQAMRGPGRGHHHEHHDHGRRAWGEPAQRIGQLGTQLGATAPADASTVPATADAVVEPGSAAGAAAAAAGTPAAVPLGEPSRQSRLLDAFGALAEALRLPAAPDVAALRSQLSTFLQTLAERLRGAAPAPLQPGALVDVTA